MLGLPCTTRTATDAPAYFVQPLNAPQWYCRDEASTKRNGETDGISLLSSATRHHQWMSQYRCTSTQRTASKHERTPRGRPRDGAAQAPHLPRQSRPDLSTCASQPSTQLRTNRSFCSVSQSMATTFLHFHITNRTCRTAHGTTTRPKPLTRLTYLDKPREEHAIGTARATTPRQAKPNPRSKRSSQVEPLQDRPHSKSKSPHAPTIPSPMTSSTG